MLKLFYRMVVVLLAPCLMLPAIAETNPPAAKVDPQMAVYRWALKTGNVDAFAEWIGRSDVWGEEFTNNESWENIRNPGWLIKPWSEWVKSRAGRRLIYGLPMLTGGWDGNGPKQGVIGKGLAVSLAEGAKGTYNEHYRVLAESLVKAGLGETILRPGWEFNGGWYTWRASKNPEAFAEFWRQIVKTMRSVKGAEKLQFCWNPALGWQQFPSDKAWPGDEFVDYVGVDVYDDSWAKDTYPIPENATAEEALARRKKAWNEVIYGGSFGLKQWSKFAKDHHKPLAIPEWGVSDRPDHHGGLDNPYFIEQMHAFITDPANNVAWHCYFDVQAPDGKHQLSPGKSGTEKIEFPKAAARFKELFGKSK